MADLLKLESVLPKIWVLCQRPRWKLLRVRKTRLINRCCSCSYLQRQYITGNALHLLLLTVHSSFYTLQHRL